MKKTQVEKENHPEPQKLMHELENYNKVDSEPKNTMEIHMLLLQLNDMKKMLEKVLDS